MISKTFCPTRAKYYMLNFKEFFENLDYKDQEFSDKNGLYSVSQMIDYSNKNKTLQNIDTKMLLHNLEPSEYETGSDLPGHPEFIKRAEAASLKYPIVVINYPDGLWIADGVHRLYKANQLGLETIKGYILDSSELDKFKKNLD